MDRIVKIIAEIIVDIAKIINKHKKLFSIIAILFCISPAIIKIIEIILEMVGG